MAKITATKSGLTIKLSNDEALDLAALLGNLTSPVGGIWYDDLAGPLEAKTYSESEKVDEDGYVYEVNSTYDSISSQTAGTPEANAQKLLHEITLYQLRLNPGHYRQAAG